MIAQYNDAAYKNWDENVLEPCPNCNRTFLPKSLTIHLKSCKAGKPLKPPLIKEAAVLPQQQPPEETKDTLYKKTNKLLEQKLQEHIKQEMQNYIRAKFSNLKVETKEEVKEREPGDLEPVKIKKASPQKSAKKK